MPTVSEVANDVESGEADSKSRRTGAWQRFSNVASGQSGLSSMSRGGSKATERKHWSTRMTSSLLKHSPTSEVRRVESRNSSNLGSVARARQTTDASIPSSDMMVPSFVEPDHERGSKMSSSQNGNFNDSLFDGMYDRNQMDEDYKNSKISA